MSSFMAKQLVLQVLIFIAILGVLGVSIAVLVTLSNRNSSSDSTTVEVTPAPTLAPPTTQKNVLRKPSPISPDNPKYSSYKRYSQLLQSWLNKSVDPCDDFYAFTCSKGQAKNLKMNFEISDDENIAVMLKQIEKKDYVEQASKPVQQLAAYIHACRQGKFRDNDHAKAILDSVFTNTNAYFPMLYQDHAHSINNSDPNALALLLGYQTGAYDLATLISVGVDTNWKDPHGEQSFALFLDQPATLYGASVYKKIWNTKRQFAIEGVVAVMKAVAGIYSINLDAEQLKADATAVVDFDYELATNFSSDSVLRRQNDRSYQPRTISDLQKELPYLNWTSLLQLMTSASLAASARLVDPSFFVIVKEPVQLARLADIFSGDAARQAVVNNYVFFRVAAFAAQFIEPASTANTRDEVSLTGFLDDLAWERHSSGRPIRGRPQRPRLSTVASAADDELAVQCMNNAMGLPLTVIGDLQWVTARIFVDGVYPTKEDRDAVRKNVGSIVQSILVAFRSQLDQLSWMTASTKRGAYSKIDNLVMNIAFPDWVTDDNKLSDYYKDLDISSADEFLTMKTKVNAFNMKKKFDVLAINERVDRAYFSGPPGTTNAWYQFELNSITFPGGILHPPFYDVNYPAAVNYGSMGVIAGHELTHGFDDNGVQWDATGVLRSWMDANSSLAFSDMAACVIEEYAGFCPLGPGRPCIDGAQTQGENIADNGGMQAAYRAFRAAIALNGPDPLLPDDSSIFSDEQLFFLSFANLWCEVPPADAALEETLLIDVHSPSHQRVFGTIQNFPAFRNAFNCPVNTPYAPEKHCKVWISDMAPASTDDKGIPVVSGNDINVKAPEEIGTKNLVKYNAYKSAFQLFNDSIDFTTDPCDDFYQYACGHYPGRQNTFYDLNDNNERRIARKLNDPTYAATVKSSQALTKLKTFFGRCMGEQANPTTKNNHLVKSFVDKLKEIIGFYPTFLVKNPIDKVDSKSLANALAFLSFEHGIDTLITPLVDTNWKAAGYEFYVDQSTLFFENVYYQEKPWGTIETSYRLAAKALVKNYCLLANITYIDIAEELIDKAISFEKDLGSFYTSLDDVRRNFTRQHNTASLQKPPPFAPALDIDSYIHSAYAPDELKAFPADKEFIVKELEMSRRLFQALNGSKYEPSTIVNYLFMRLLLNYDNLVDPSESDASSHLHKLKQLRTTHGRPQRRRSPLEAESPDASLECAAKAMILFADASGRVFMDDAFPTEEHRKNLRTSAGGVIKNVLDAFSGMITQLDWMDNGSMKGAQDKITNVVKNVAFPDKLYDVAQLDAEYEKLDIDMKTTYYELLVRINKFNIAKQFKQLTMKEADRHDFLGQTSIVNAWYQPELNSITFPAGILQAPFFDDRNPAALNYGAMGIVAGHELTHGFDDEGVQWNSVGLLDSWMTPESAANFSAVAQCVIDQYSNFCPLPESEPVRCINGVQTQGENIADNGGIHAAWRAFLSHRELNGPDPLFADHVFSQFSEEQLFFLNFAQVWCMAPLTKDNIITGILTDPHVFGFYRVLGSLQNFPAFRAAFNCPIGSKYAPTDHCKVWVPFVMAK